MTTLTIIKDDGFVNVDGVGLDSIDCSSLASNVHAVQFNGTHGSVEYNDGTVNLAITAISDYSTITDAHATQKATNESDAATAATNEATAAATPQGRRMREYPSIKDQLDDIYHNGIVGWKATIKVTKDKYPK